MAHSHNARLQQAMRRALDDGARQPNDVSDLDWMWFTIYARHERVNLDALSEYAGVTRTTLRRWLEIILWKVAPESDYDSIPWRKMKERARQ
jgi:hypothetical protein